MLALVPTSPPRLTYLRIRNYRALRDVEFRDLMPLTVLIGANGSGQSTVLDALDFWAEFERGYGQEAWKKRNGINGLHSVGDGAPLQIEGIITPVGSHQQLVRTMTVIADSYGTPGACFTLEESGRFRQRV
ncbi:MAG: AAA family ATPase [Hymenobacteraceae bacterium]|nr:AAA family ATPase [Hymenobacteraceae bacterium]